MWVMKGEEDEAECIILQLNSKKRKRWAERWGEKIHCSTAERVQWRQEAGFTHPWRFTICISLLKTPSTVKFTALNFTQQFPNLLTTVLPFSQKTY